MADDFGVGRLSLVMDLLRKRLLTLAKHCGGVPAMRGLARELLDKAGCGPGRRAKEREGDSSAGRAGKERENFVLIVENWSSAGRAILSILYPSRQSVRHLSLCSPPCLRAHSHDIVGNAA